MLGLSLQCTDHNTNTPHLQDAVIFIWTNHVIFLRHDIFPLKQQNKQQQFLSKIWLKNKCLLVLAPFLYGTSVSFRIRFSLWVVMFRSWASFSWASFSLLCLIASFSLSTTSPAPSRSRSSSSSCSTCSLFRCYGCLRNRFKMRLIVGNFMVGWYVFCG